MDIYILNSELEQVAIIDEYKSFIWNKQYCEFGECEIYIPATAELVDVLRIGNYITTSADDMVCRIDRVELDENVEDGDWLIIEGTDVRGILHQRVVWEDVVLTGTAEDIMRSVITNNVINPSVAERKISQVGLGVRQGYTEEIYRWAKYSNVGATIIEICKMFGYGSRMPLADGKFKFELYKGTDRFSEEADTHVAFSSEYDNIVSTNYVADKRQYKNVVLATAHHDIHGDISRTIGSGLGIDRYEMYVDVGELTYRTPDGVYIDHNEVLADAGASALVERTLRESFDGKVESTYTYKYREHYDLGDIVMMRNDYGIVVPARITEVIEVYDEGGYSVIPKFTYGGA